MSKNRQQNLLMKKNRSDGIDATGAFPRSKSNSMIEHVAAFLEERNLYGDKYICTFVIFITENICMSYLRTSNVLIMFCSCFCFCFFTSTKNFKNLFSTAILFISVKTGNMLINVAFKKTKNVGVN